MRYTADHKAQARKRLLEKAGALAKTRGFGTTGVDALVKAAGLTSGAFYAHFSSKSEMLAALVANELERSLELFPIDSPNDIERALNAYLSVNHVENPEGGCVLPALTAEVARSDDTVRERFEHLLLQIKDRIALRSASEQEAWSSLSQLVGSVMLARAMHTEKSRKAILRAVKQSIAPGRKAGA